MRKRAATAAVITATTVLGSALAFGGAATATPSRTAIPNSKPTWLAHATHYGAAETSAGMSARVYLTPKGGMRALQSFVNSVSSPGSSSYQHFLSAAQYHARFSPTDSSADAVSSYLRSAGLTVTAVGDFNRYVAVRGTVGQMQSAFGVRIDRYKHGKQQVKAPTGSVEMPTSVAGNVLGVTGLDTTKATAKPMHSAPADVPAGFRNSRPCSTYFGQVQADTAADYKTPLPKFRNKTLSYVLCGYTGPQFRSAYEGDTTLDGSGVTVGILDAYASPTIQFDSNKYATDNGDGSYARGQFVQTKPSAPHAGGLCGPTGWYGEETLDVEAVHAMAPGANIHYYGGNSCIDSDLTDTLSTMVNQNKVQIISNSYGDAGEGVPSAEIQASETVFLQAAAQGISLLFSSGDNGDAVADTGIKQPDYEASDPYVTAVGGTATAIDQSGKAQFTTGWGTDLYPLSADGKSWGPGSFQAGAGGGTSRLFNQPSYQSSASTSAYRQVPDVAMDADNATGMLIGETQQFSNGTYYDQFRLGGTSLASPLFAGMTALAVQNHGGRNVGFLNPKIYANTGNFFDIGGNPPAAGVVRVNFVNGEDASDGLSYSVRTFNTDASLRVTKGYDLVTGVGVPKPSYLTSFAK